MIYSIQVFLNRFTSQSDFVESTQTLRRFDKTNRVKKSISGKHTHDTYVGIKKTIHTHDTTGAALTNLDPGT